MIIMRLNIVVDVSHSIPYWPNRCVTYKVHWVRGREGTPFNYLYRIDGPPSVWHGGDGYRKYFRR